jgi:NAD(P)H dehydrogenase (quinone)
MKNVLVIVANPKKDSLSFAIANRVKKVNEDIKNSVEILDLYKDEKRQDFFIYEENAFHFEPTKEMLYYQEKIKKADEIVIVFPYWWGSMPAILKNFFDWNLSAGFAYTYEKGTPKGLLKGKDVKVYTTTGAPKFFYFLNGANRRLEKMFKDQIIEFCAMNLKEFNIFGGIDSGFKGAQKIVDSIKA